MDSETESYGISILSGCSLLELCWESSSKGAEHQWHYGREGVHVG